MLHDRGIGVRLSSGTEIIFFCTASWSALCPTQLPILSAAMDHFPGLPIKVEHSTTSGVYVDMVEVMFMSWCLLDPSLGNKSGGRTDLAFLYVPE